MDEDQSEPRVRVGDMDLVRKGKLFLEQSFTGFCLYVRFRKMDKYDEISRIFDSSCQSACCVLSSQTLKSMLLACLLARDY